MSNVDLGLVSEEALIAELVRRWDSVIIAVDRLDMKSVQGEKAQTQGSFQVKMFGSISSCIGLSDLIRAHVDQEMDRALGQSHA